MTETSISNRRLTTDRAPRHRLVAHRPRQIEYLQLPSLLSHSEDGHFLVFKHAAADAVEFGDI